uniref:DsrE/DsrF-like family protein n=1 Tax=Candidatus Kentrum sp. LPFa TaxID=2126335 RepID=A0A450XSD6_9GAMM|nr:MAG: DsrE/DsrF-like family protein [Candidatus Kentron sp. LPFa]VFK32192.1 MAG: DsrE/DsrF-like family protein [Candidatus Kentron sp. LPFa]
MLITFYFGGASLCHEILHFVQKSHSELPGGLDSAEPSARFMPEYDSVGASALPAGILIFGAGVNALKYYAPIPISDKVKEAKYAGFRIVACKKAMRTYKLRPSDMLPEVRYVESGVAELVEKQTGGWSYVRP